MKLLERVIKCACASRVSRSRIFSLFPIIEKVIEKCNTRPPFDYRDDIDYRVLQKYMLPKVTPCRICFKRNCVYKQICAYSMLLGKHITIILCDKCACNPKMEQDKAALSYRQQGNQPYFYISEATMYTGNRVIFYYYNPNPPPPYSSSSSQTNHVKTPHYFNYKKHEIQKICYQCMFCKKEVPHKTNMQRKYVICKDTTIAFAHKRCLSLRYRRRK